MARPYFSALLAIGMMLGGNVLAQDFDQAPEDTLPANLPPPPSDPRNIEGVWKPWRNNRYAAANLPIAGGLPGNAPKVPGGGAPPPGAFGRNSTNVSGTQLVCAPARRINGAGGSGESNLWIQGDQEIVLISEEDQDIRKIYLRADHLTNIPPQPNGNSIGHWEGNILVVDSIGFSGANGKDAGLHIIEHISKNGKVLTDEATTISHGTTTHQLYKSDWRPDLQVWENVCEEGYSDFQIINGDVQDIHS